MTDCRLLEEGGRAHFMTRRFDRTDDGTKIHTQTLCALGHLDFLLIGAHDYSQLFDMAERLGLGPETRAEVFRRMVFNVATANCDDHTKNFSFVLAPRDAWQLAPAYDVTHAHNPQSRWTAQHLMAVNGHSAGITVADLDEVGDRFAVPAARAIIEQVLDVAASWSEFAAEAGVGRDATGEVGGHISAMCAPLHRRAVRRG
jgi:serine/threonine-protein kinase HipA